VITQPENKETIDYTPQHEIDKEKSTGLQTAVTPSSSDGQKDRPLCKSTGNYLNPFKNVEEMTTKGRGKEGRRMRVLANHFPNHTPAQLADRLLASANNDLNGAYNLAGTTTFLNGITHQYTSEAGHGIMDLPASLGPITSNATVRSAFSGSQLNAGAETYNAGQIRGYSLGTSGVLASRSFGDAITNALSTESTYFYDAMDGGFKFSLDKLTDKSKPIKLNDMQLAKVNIKSVSSSLSESQNRQNKTNVSDQKNYFYPTPNSNSRAMSKFFDTGKPYALSKKEYALPFLNTIQGGTGADLGVKLGSGYLTASLAATSSENVSVTKQRSLIASYQDNNKTLSPLSVFHF
jgi:hypothetical protein